MEKTEGQVTPAVGNPAEASKFNATQVYVNPHVHEVLTALQRVQNGEIQYADFQKNYGIGELLNKGRDIVFTEFAGYKLRPDCCYRTVSISALESYFQTGFIQNLGASKDSIDWYLGGAAKKYGRYVIECPAYKEYFMIRSDEGEGFGNRMARNPNVVHIVSFNNNPIPLSLITNIFDTRTNRIIPISMLGEFLEQAKHEERNLPVQGQAESSDINSSGSFDGFSGEGRRI